MDIRDIRRQNLWKLLDREFGTARGAQSRLAEKLNKPQNFISRCLAAPEKSGSKTIGEDFAREIETVFKLERYSLDSELCFSPSMNDSPASQNKSPSKDDYVLIPQYSASGSCGDGCLADHVEINGGLAFKRDWIKRIGVKAENLFAIYAKGDSMEPYIFDGDVVLIDTSSIDPRNGQVYAIRRTTGEISIKRLVQQFAGGWIIRSDNPDRVKYADEPVSEAVLHEIPIIGRVIWRGGGVG